MKSFSIANYDYKINRQIIFAKVYKYNINANQIHKNGIESVIRMGRWLCLGSWHGCTHEPPFPMWTALVSIFGTGLRSLVFMASVDGWMMMSFVFILIASEPHRPPTSSATAGRPQ